MPDKNEIIGYTLAAIILMAPEVPQPTSSSDISRELSL